MEAKIDQKLRFSWESLQRRHQDAPRRPQDAPKSAQDAPKSTQDAPKTPPRAPKTPPRRPQDAPRRFKKQGKNGRKRHHRPKSRPNHLQTSILERFGVDLGGFGGRFLKVSRSFFEGFGMVLRMILEAWRSILLWRFPFHCQAGLFLIRVFC